MANGEKKQTLSRALHLEVLCNSGKAESLRYSSHRYVKYVQHWLVQLFYNHFVKHLSTSGMGQLANQAQHKAIGILNAQKEAKQEKVSCPEVKFVSCPGLIEASQDSSFDYWVSFEDQFSKKRIRIPAKSHKRLNHFLRQGWALNKSCELVQMKNGRFKVRIFVQKESAQAVSKEESVGVDLGLNHCVARSDGYLGRSAARILKAARSKDAQRRRQGHPRSFPKSTLRQQLDSEARRAVNVSKAQGKNLIVEDPKVLANLKPRLQWARSYFANRCCTLGEEEGVFVWKVYPGNTSRTCHKCGYVARESRVKLRFKCLGCGNSTHADINAARVIARKGTEKIRLRLMKNLA